MRKYTYIVAGTYAEYLEYQYRKFDENVALGTKPKSYVYVDFVDRLRGMNEVHGFFIGTYEQRPDIAEIKEMILIINSKTPAPSILSAKGMNPVSVWLDEFPSIVGSMSTKV